MKNKHNYKNTFRVLNNEFHEIHDLREFLPSSFCIVTTGSEYLKKRFRYSGAGAATEIKSAYIRATFELIERYFGSVNQRDKNLLVHGKYSDLKASNNIINPNEINLFNESYFDKKQFGYKKLTEEDEVLWVECISSKRKKILIPAFLIFWDFPNFMESYYIPNTAGLACGENLLIAKESATFELYEKNALSKIWYYQLEHEHILYTSNAIKQYFKKNKNITYLLGNDNVNISFINMNNFLPSSMYGTICIIKFIKDEKEYFTIGSSVGTDIEIVYEKAIIESYSEIPYLLNNYFKTSKWLTKTIKEVKSTLLKYEDHLLFYNYFSELRDDLPFFNWGKSQFDTEINSTILKRDSTFTEDLNNSLDSLYYVELNQGTLSIGDYSVVKCFSPFLNAFSPRSNSPFIPFIKKKEKKLLEFAANYPHCYS